MSQLDLLVCLVYQVALEHFGSIKILPKHNKAKLRKFSLSILIGMHKLNNEVAFFSSSTSCRMKSYLEEYLVDDTKISRERLIHYINTLLRIYNNVYKERA